MFLHRPGRKAEVDRVRQAVERAGRGAVTEVRERAVAVPPPTGLNTVQLLKACSAGLGLAPAQAMQVAPPPPSPTLPPHTNPHPSSPFAGWLPLSGSVRRRMPESVALPSVRHEASTMVLRSGSNPLTSEPHV